MWCKWLRSIHSPRCSCASDLARQDICCFLPKQTMPVVTMMTLLWQLASAAPASSRRRAEWRPHLSGRALKYTCREPPRFVLFVQPFSLTWGLLPHRLTCRVSSGTSPAIYLLAVLDLRHEEGGHRLAVALHLCRPETGKSGQRMTPRWIAMQHTGIGAPFLMRRTRGRRDRAAQHSSPAHRLLAVVLLRLHLEDDDLVRAVVLEHLGVHLGACSTEQRSRYWTRPDAR